MNKTHLPVNLKNKKRQKCQRWEEEKLSTESTVFTNNNMIKNLTVWKNIKELIYLEYSEKKKQG